MLYKTLPMDQELAARRASSKTSIIFATCCFQVKLSSAYRLALTPLVRLVPFLTSETIAAARFSEVDPIGSPVAGSPVSSRYSR